ncbi:MAG: CDP-diacylglycerol--glycerol-3-phosphate 3-phosphatidyltransferase [Planctomycetota bacterium]
MNIPNRITVARLALAVVLFILLGYLDAEPSAGWGWTVVAGIVFVIAAASDALDGYLARELGQVTDFGRVTDPVVDKVVICGSFIFLTASSWARPLLPPWVVVIVVGREFLVTGIRGLLEVRGVPFGASWAGKGKMLSQCFTVPGILAVRVCDMTLPSLSSAARWLALALVTLTVAMTLLSGATYMARAVRLLRHE